MLDDPAAAKEFHHLRVTFALDIICCLISQKLNYLTVTTMPLICWLRSILLIQNILWYSGLIYPALSLSLTQFHKDLF